MCQDGVAHVEYHLEGSYSEQAHGKTGGKPFGFGQIPQNLRDSFPSELHRTIGHQDMDRLIGIPNIEVRMQQSERLRVVPNRSYDDARLARSVLRRPLYPMPKAAANGALIVE
jgi:hypothetical protein